MLATTHTGLPLLRFSIFGDHVVHAISTRRGGVSLGPFSSLNLSAKVGDALDLVRQNRELFLTSLGLKPESTVALTQVHGHRVVLVLPRDRGRGVTPSARPPEQADAVITQAPGVALMILAADCVPILLWDPVHRAIGAAHAGWRGTTASIATKTLRAMREAFGTDATAILIGIGPSIGLCCYEVDRPVLQPLRRRFPNFYRRVTRPTRPGHRRLDLRELNRLQLVAAGVPEPQIEVLDLCTACNPDLLYSERGEGRPSGRFGAVIALRS